MPRDLSSYSNIIGNVENDVLSAVLKKIILNSAKLSKTQILMNKMTKEIHAYTML